MKYLILVGLFILSLGYAGYYLYIYDKKDVKQESIIITNKNNRVNQKRIPEHLTKNFWLNVTPDQLREKLNNIKDINEVRQDNKRNMLHELALFGKYPEMVGLLISAGINYRLKDNSRGRQLKALHYIMARRSSPLEFAIELLKYDTDVNDYGIGRRGIKLTPLMSAVFNRAPIELIKLLLEKGADPNLPETGSHSLIVACLPNKRTNISFIDPKVIELLLSYKADPTRKNQRGKTAYDYMKENPEFVKTALFQKLSQSISTK